MDSNWIAVGNGNYVTREDMNFMVGDRIAKILLDVSPTELRGQLLYAISETISEISVDNLRDSI